MEALGSTGGMPGRGTVENVTLDGDNCGKPCLNDPDGRSGIIIEGPDFVACVGPSIAISAAEKPRKCMIASLPPKLSRSPLPGASFVCRWLAVQ